MTKGHSPVLGGTCERQVNLEALSISIKRKTA